MTLLCPPVNEALVEAGCASALERSVAIFVPSIDAETEGAMDCVFLLTVPEVDALNRTGPNSAGL